MYQAQFCNIDGLHETDICTGIGLFADTKDAAEDEALDLPRPPKANFVKILFDGRPVSRLGLAL